MSAATGYVVPSPPAASPWPHERTTAGYVLDTEARHDA